MCQVEKLVSFPIPSVKVIAFAQKGSCDREIADVIGWMGIEVSGNRKIREMKTNGP